MKLYILDDLDIIDNMYEFYAYSSKGNHRNVNEDCFLINNHVSNESYYQKMTKFKFKNREEFVVAIADGVGGHKGGAFASQYILNQLANIKETDYIPTVREQIYTAHHKLRIESAKHNLPKAATTLTLLTSLNEYITIYHVGDTRAYKLTPTKLVQLTTDQTKLQEIINELPIFSPVRKYLPFNNVLLKAIGASMDSLSIDITKTTIEPNDILLLTTDGIHDYLSNSEIETILRKYKSIKTVVHKLITKASNISKDNMTAIGIHFKN